MDIGILSIYIANLPLLREQAYLDPGSGSFLIQMLIAGLIGIGFTVKMYWKKIKGLFTHSSEKPEAETLDDTDQQS